NGQKDHRPVKADDHAFRLPMRTSLRENRLGGFGLHGVGPARKPGQEYVPAALAARVYLGSEAVCLSMISTISATGMAQTPPWAFRHSAKTFDGSGKAAELWLKRVTLASKVVRLTGMCGSTDGTCGLRK